MVACALVAVALTVGGCKAEKDEHSSHATSTATASAAASAPPKARAETGIAGCDAYFRAAEACFETADDELKDQLRESIARYDNQLEQAASDVAKQAVGVGCSAAHESLKDEPACN